MTEYQNGYQDGLTVLGIDKLVFAVTALESAANWLRRSENADALAEADRINIAVYFSRALNALDSLQLSLPSERETM